MENHKKDGRKTLRTDGKLSPLTRGSLLLYSGIVVQGRAAGGRTLISACIGRSRAGPSGEEAGVVQCIISNVE